MLFFRRLIFFATYDATFWRRALILAQIIVWKNIEKIFFGYQPKRSSGHVECRCSFDKPAEKFPTNIR